MTNVTPEIIEKAKSAKSAEELLALAKANGVELTEEGVYEFTFLAIDETGNMSRVTMKTYAEGE